MEMKGRGLLLEFGVVAEILLSFLREPSCFLPSNRSYASQKELCAIPTNFVDKVQFKPDFQMIARTAADFEKAVSIITLALNLYDPFVASYPCNQMKTRLYLGGALPTESGLVSLQQEFRRKSCD